MYRTLISRPHVGPWRSKPITRVGYYTDLYTRFTPEGETDEIETWLNRDFEQPADGALRKATLDEPLNDIDWHAIVRFVAAQIVRTPAFFIRTLPIWNKITPEILKQTLNEFPHDLALAAKGELAYGEDPPHGELFPIQTRKEVDEEAGTVNLTVTVTIGRDIWFYTMKHMLTHTLRVLHNHSWTILKAPNCLTWFTSDDPVLTLNYHSESAYNFGGGWNSPGTEIILPISPRHLLYTHIAKPVPALGTVVDRRHAQMLRFMIAQHAHREIYALTEDKELPALRPRRVDAKQFRRERDQWTLWNSGQTKVQIMRC